MLTTSVGACAGQFEAEHPLPHTDRVQSATVKRLTASAARQPDTGVEKLTRIRHSTPLSLPAVKRLSVTTCDVCHINCRVRPQCPADRTRSLLVITRCCRRRHSRGQGGVGGRMVDRGRVDDTSPCADLMRVTKAKRQHVIRGLALRSV